MKLLINGKELDINKLINEQNLESILVKKRKKDIYLSDNDIDILRKYNIDYNSFSSLSSLIFEIEYILNNESDCEDLESVSFRLSEYNYYNNTNK